jgi:DNA-binding MurR/RpiR family transcriptional regulator
MEVRELKIRHTKSIKRIKMNREQILLLKKENLKAMRKNKKTRNTYTIKKIAKMCGVSVSTIHQRLKEYNI